MTFSPAVSTKETDQMKYEPEKMSGNAPESKEWTEQNSPDMPMKWYKFIICFQLFAGALVSLAVGFGSIIGWKYGGEQQAATVYAEFSGLQIVDVILCFLYVALAVMSVVVRQRLAAFRKNGPWLYMILLCEYLLLAVISWVLETLSTGSIRLEAGMLAGWAVQFVLICLNLVYFGKRKQLFTK